VIVLPCLKIHKRERVEISFHACRYEIEPKKGIASIAQLINTLMNETWD
jgi:hypothetical protein